MYASFWPSTDPVTQIIPRDASIRQEFTVFVSKLRPGGTLWFSTNDRGFELPATGLPPLEIEETSHRTVPEDFRNRRIHRSWRMHKPGPPSEPSRLAAPTVIA
jgi:hypothetical protein